MFHAHDEPVVLETRRHGIVLARAFARSFLLSAAGIAAVPLPWPWSALGVTATLLAAVLAVAVRLERIGAVELEQSLLGRLLGYGTIVAGELEIEFVPAPRELFAVVDRVTA